MLRSALARAARRGSALAVQQQRRGFAEGAVAAQDDVWTQLEGFVFSDEGKRELASLRVTFNEVQQQLADMSKPVPPMDWNALAKQVDPQLAKMYKEAYETMPVPQYSNAEIISQFDAEFSQLEAEAKAVVAASEQRLKEVQAEIKKLEAAKERIWTATIDEELAADPKLAKEIDEEVEANHFMVVNN